MTIKYRWVFYSVSQDMRLPYIKCPNCGEYKYTLYKKYKVIHSFFHNFGNPDRKEVEYISGYCFNCKYKDILEDEDVESY